MTAWQLARRGLAHYWRTNLAVVLGVATAVAVLSGALLVGDSVRGSLRTLVTDRLGRVDHVVVATTFFRAALADDVAADPSFAARFSSPAPMLMAQGFVTAQGSGRRTGNVAVYGVGDVSGPEPRDAFLSPALAADLAVGAGDAVLVRLQRPSAIPLESLHSRKADLGRTVRVTVRRVLGAPQVGEFSVRPQQGSVRAVFVSLARLQQDLEVPGRANVVSARCGASCGRVRRSTTWGCACDVSPRARWRLSRWRGSWTRGRNAPRARALRTPDSRRSRSSAIWPTRFASAPRRCRTRS
jgi:hypothetical protein